MKAANTLLAWNGAEDHSEYRSRRYPCGSVAVGPLQTTDEPDWTRGYECTGAAAYVERRKLFGLPQQHHVMLDWYQLVYSYGIHPYTAHRAFLLIEEYQTIIRRYGMSPDKDEPGYGHPDVTGYGRTFIYPVPVLKIFHTGRGTHFWPTGEFTNKRCPTATHLDANEDDNA
jgi:hypothetical protein